MRTIAKAILVSPGFGAGWSTWNSGKTAEIMLTWQPIIEFILEGNKFTHDDLGGWRGEKPLHPLLQDMIDYIRKETNDPEAYVCILGADDLRVATVFGPFRVNEYDGNEYVEERDDIEWMNP